MKPIANALGVARYNVVEQLALKGKEAASACGPETDEVLVTRIRSIVDARGSSGYRRVTRLIALQLDAEGVRRVNHKRVYRVMRANGLRRS